MRRSLVRSFRTPGSFIVLSTFAALAGACAHGDDHAAAAPSSPVGSVATVPGPAASATAPAAGHRVIVFVWDGLRPDSVDEKLTPRLYALGHRGTAFPDHHATYPTFTMMNAAAFATGGLPATTGFYGNTLWSPQASRRAPDGAVLLNDAGAPQTYSAPVFSEDYAVLRDLDAFYGGDLLEATSLFDAVQARGMTTAAVGKSGPAFLQDRHEKGYVLDEKAVWPLSLATELQAAGIALPKATGAAYVPGAIHIDASQNGDPTTFPPAKTLSDGRTTNPADESGPAAGEVNAYLMGAYLDFILPKKKPDYSVLWFRNPDTTEHWYGPGTANAKRSLADLDALLGKLEDKLTTLGWMATTDIVVVSDHGHSTVSGPLDVFPLRAVTSPAGGKGEPDGGAVDASGFSASGDVRLADLLTTVGKFKAWDGAGCMFDPVLSGIDGKGRRIRPVRTDDAAGTVCGKDPKTGHAGIKYNTPSYRVPSVLPADALIVAANGGSDYIYVPSHDAALVARVVKFLQSREEIGPIFVGAAHTSIPGTLPMSALGVEAPGRAPEMIVSYEYDENAVVQGMRGIEFESAQNYRGMHGSFSPIDIHNTLFAAGPDFRQGWVDPLPTANVDVAPTVARIFGLTLPRADGRSLDEALGALNVQPSSYTLSSPEPTASTEATHLRMMLPTDTDGTRVDPKKTRYRVLLKTRTLAGAGKTYTYYDWARAVREP